MPCKYKLFVFKTKLKKYPIFVDSKMELIMDWQTHIVSDPNVLMGKPVIKGTRLSVEFILERLASGWTEQEVLENYPRLTRKDIQAIHAYAYDCLKDGLLFQPLAQNA